MGQFKFPLAVRDTVLHWMEEIPNSEIERMERPIDRLPDATWYNYRCRVRNAVALLSISEHQQLPCSLMVSVSTDMRRILRLTTVYRDFRLSFAIAHILKRHGGETIDD